MVVLQKCMQLLGILVVGVLLGAGIRFVTGSDLAGQVASFAIGLLGSHFVLKDTLNG